MKYFVEGKKKNKKRKEGETKQEKTGNAKG